MFSCERSSSVFNAICAGLYLAMQEGEDLKYFDSKRDSFPSNAQLSHHVLAILFMINKLL
jgi:hypothetical protein